MTVSFEKDQGAVVLHGAKGMAKGETEESDFWLYIVKLISDGNLWELTVSDDEKQFSARLYMPAVKRGEEFFIRESALLGFAEISEYFFG